MSRVPDVLLPILRQLSDGRFHSGQSLAEQFGLSRASVCNAVAMAEGMGVRVHAVTGRGYRLAEPVEWLDAWTVRDHLGEIAERYRLTMVDVVESTNAALMREALAGAPSGSVLCAEHQTHGKGRRGRPWRSVLGGSLTFSILWRFERGIHEFGGLSLAVGLAVARAVNRFSEHRVRLKWPNDVLLDYRKLAGILVEVQGDLHGASFAVVGIGMNVNLSPEQRDAIDQAVVDLAEMGVAAGRNELLAACLEELDGIVEVLRRQGFGALRGEWMDHDAYAGRRVRLSMPDGTSLVGQAGGVDTSGAFVLRDEQGTMRSYSGGEIQLRPVSGEA
jgi:BirA family biotin operon repressor/biotin-[acetyl-CoA-carboxylase] ligase